MKWVKHFYKSTLQFLRDLQDIEKTIKFSDVMQREIFVCFRFLVCLSLVSMFSKTLGERLKMS